MKKSLRLMDMIALRTLAAGVALVQRVPAAGFQSGLADGEGAHSSQFPYFFEDTGLIGGDKLAAAIYRLACRTSFAAPGYALIRQCRITSSKEQRESLVALKENLSNLHREKVGQRLGWFSINRFDQKNTSKPHRDGAPGQSLLLVGYEPSKVASDLFVADYSACAHQLGLTPVQYLEEFNPMYKKGMDNLAPYVMPLVEFDPAYYNILIVNNSSMSLNREENHWQGVLHYADIQGPSTSPRVINSLSITPMGEGEKDTVSPEALQAFLTDEGLNENNYARTQAEPV